MTSSTTSPATSTRFKAKVLCAVQQPLVASAFADVMSVPAWKSPALVVPRLSGRSGAPG